jgi:hypothetical protein
MALISTKHLTQAQFQRLEPAAVQHALRALLRDRVIAQRETDEYHDKESYRPLIDLALREAALETRRNNKLTHVIEALATAGVPALIFKGTALAHSHYAPPELRERDDTALAVDQLRQQVAGNVLELLGFRPMVANEGSLIMRQRLYRRRDSDGVLHNIDLHWAISNSARTARLTVRSLLARSVALPALSSHARMPNSIDALLIACAHLDANHVDKVGLVWLYDLQSLIENMPIEMRINASQRALACGLTPASGWVMAALTRTFGSSLLGFEPLTARGDIAPPSGRRLAQWQRELLALRDNRTRMTWLWQQMIPDRRHLRASAGTATSLWRLYLARALRGVSHLSR